MKIIKENYKFILFLIFIFILFQIRFPYYIDAPGGISNMNDKIDIKGYKVEGSFNLAYVKEYRATIPTLLISLFNKDYNILKEDDVMLDSETIKDYNLRDKILMDESISNAINVSYNYANKDIKVLDNKLLISYVSSDAKTNLKVGDKIISINDKNIESKKDIENIIKTSTDDELNIKVENNGKTYNRYAKLIKEKDDKKIGILINTINEYKTDPSIDIKISANESGPSGGLIMALSIYNLLVKQDITKGYTIVGTGTIDLDGNVGSIGGVKYKLKSAVKEKADIFIVPNDENYKEAMSEKKKNNYDIKIVGVSTFDDAIKYLENLN